MESFLFKEPLENLDNDLYQLIEHESERQQNRLILIPSESVAPPAVREALGSVFQNVYAEGYPHEITRHMPEAEILNYEERLNHYRRFADPRYYKGVEFADMLEALTRQRCAEVFAANGLSPEDLYVNVQPLSGAPANNAVYTALLQPGDTLMGMNLLHGGHLTHGSPVNRSGKLFNIVSYEVDPETEQLDYDAIEALALKHKPKIIIAGYSSYPMIPDWARFKAIAKKVGAKLLTDVSHIAGLIAAKVIPSPVGHADIITFTTHKTLCGPRGACIIVNDAALGATIDKAVFPGEQGGPHLNTIAAMAAMFKIAATPQFKQLQQHILDNCAVMVEQLEKRGIDISYGGTNSHLANINCRSITGADGAPLSGDLAARILDVAGIVANRNTIPGDKSALRAFGVRFGTPWITQRGFGEEESRKLADLIADLLLATKPYKIESRTGYSYRAKVDFEVLENVKLGVAELCQKIDSYTSHQTAPYPFNYYTSGNSDSEWISFELSGDKINEFSNFVFESDIESLMEGKSQKTSFSTPSGAIPGVVKKLGNYHYQLCLPANRANYGAAWLRDLSDAYTIFDDDLQRRIPGPVIIADSNMESVTQAESSLSSSKPWFIGCNPNPEAALPDFEWIENPDQPIKKTVLHATHVAAGARMVPFAGWEMPVQYTSIQEEHAATRTAAGLFDVSHMGVLQAEGPDAAMYLDSVCGNDISGLDVGKSCYTHLLTPDAEVIDDLIIYRRSSENFLIVVNAANKDKDWSWLTSVKAGSVKIDNSNPGAIAYGRNVILKDLSYPAHGADRLVDLALQGKASTKILLALNTSKEAEKELRQLKRSSLMEGEFGGFQLIISRTGYTGENIGYEIFIHPDQAVAFWQKLIELGEPFGLKPCGLGARDSLRTEYGLPLYGHEMAGPLNATVGEAGFSYFVKTYKPWFIGREAFIEQEENRTRELVRFRFEEQRTRKAHLGDPVLNEKGKVIGAVTSCAIDSDGFFTGQAIVDKSNIKEGSVLLIFQDSPDKVNKSPSILELNDRIVLPSRAIILSRYQKL